MEYCSECGSECAPVTLTDDGFWSEAWGSRQWHPPVDYEASDCCEAEITYDPPEDE